MSRQLLRRAETIKRKSDELLSLVMAAWPDDDYPSDLADSLRHVIGDLIEAIERRTLTQGEVK